MCQEQSFLGDRLFVVARGRLREGAKSCAKPDRTKRVTLYRYVGPKGELWDMEKAYSVWGRDDKDDDLAAVPVTGVGKVLLRAGDHG